MFKRDKENTTKEKRGGEKLLSNRKKKSVLLTVVLPTLFILYLHNGFISEQDNTEVLGKVLPRDHYINFSMVQVRSENSELC